MGWASGCGELPSAPPLPQTRGGGGAGTGSPQATEGWTGAAEPPTSALLGHGCGCREVGFWRQFPASHQELSHARPAVPGPRGRQHGLIYPPLPQLRGHGSRPAASLLAVADGWDRREPTCGSSALSGLSRGYRRALFSNKQVEGLLFLSIIPSFFPAEQRGRRSHMLSIFKGLKKAPSDYLKPPEASAVRTFTHWTWEVQAPLPFRSRPFSLACSLARWEAEALRLWGYERPAWSRAGGAEGLHLLPLQGRGLQWSPSTPCLRAIAV